MSRKANNLRKRLRVEVDRAPRLERECRRREEFLASAQQRVAAELKKAVALNIRIDSVHDHQFGDVLQISTMFRPEMFRYDMLHRRDGPVGGMPCNISYHAARIAAEMADKVRAAIIEYVETGKVGK